MKYTRWPILVDAFQVTEEDIDSAPVTRSCWPDWLRYAWNKPNGTSGAVWEELDKKRATILMVMADQYYSFCYGEEYAIAVKPGDWIINKGNGVLSVCQNNLFEKEYVACE